MFPNESVFVALPDTEPPRTKFMSVGEVMDMVGALRFSEYLYAPNVVLLL